jgi:hypothetical protein
MNRPAFFDLDAFRRLIGALARSPNVSVVLELVDESLKHGLKLDYDCFAIIVKLHCKQGALSLAADLLADMQDCRPTVSLCEVVIQACVSGRDSAVARRTLELMGGLSIRPSSTVLASVVRFLGKEADVQDTIAVIRGLPGLDIDLHVQDTLLRVLLAGHHIELAFEQLRIMKETGLLPSSMTCDIVLQECLQQGQLCLAAALVEEALLADRGMSPQLLNHLLQAMGRRGALQAMPLARKIIGAGVEVPQSLLDALQRGSGCASLMASRRSEWHQWRSKFGDHVASGL